MHLLILDGSTDDAPIPGHVVQVASSLGARLTRFKLAELCLAPCLGDFACWLQTPGRCRSQDAQQDILHAFQAADLVVFLTPVVFGGYGSILKKAVDRLIPSINPFFHQRDGLTRHTPRYAAYPAMLFIGWADQLSNQARRSFADLAGGNAINMQAPNFRSLLVTAADSAWQNAVSAAIRAGLQGAPGDPWPSAPGEALFAACTPDLVVPEPVAPRRATIFVGSARPKGSSSSESLGRALAAGLEQAGVATTLVHAVSFIKAGRAAEKALSTMLAGELLVIAAPLYVDTLPALATHALERLAERLPNAGYPLRTVVGLLNCGFPEAAHNRTAMVILRNFTQQAGLLWSGGLAMGAGEILHGQALSKARLLRPQRRALALAARDLAAGRPLSPEASKEMASPLVPPSLFRWLGAARWLWQARRHGLGWRQLVARPFERRQTGS